ncbi:Cyn operon transcriptional activator [Thalassovita gelatinovora]|uniref:Cyn operon transcriptional activator n=1 Tax=Thalassovita gelatinovora TaxID=53501 RepID=A0A0P1G500_THAGE|nr:LysR family transcriptional regulator [Thalassovita gelatinovora]QIZ82315.1 LysR family transcriptional regulator [Thalassovita gelatinovora]CUH68365.1 Cyn operon transcriptional activator [Thalassovita gelatinovora]SER19280.1 DNA-binding transcriptional regulator, LysR family [Thalassovita gelatinovora]
MRLRELEALAAIFETGTVSEAAKLLGVGQPAISRTLGRLEDKLGYPLFNRVGGRLVPTRSANAIRQEVQTVLAGMNNLRRITADLLDKRAGELKFGCAQSLIHTLIPRAVGAFSSAWPDVRLTIEPRPTRILVDQVASRKLELALLFLPVEHPGIETEPLDWFPSVCVLPSDHPLADRDMIGPEDLAGERMIMLSKTDPARFPIEHAFRQARVTPFVTVETPSVALAVKLVESGRGVTIVNSLMARDLNSERVAVAPFRPELRHQLALIRPASYERTAESEAFAKIISDCSTSDMAKQTFF